MVRLRSASLLLKLMKYNGKLLIKFRIFEVRGSHLDYKPPEIKTSHLLKQTEAMKGKTHLPIDKHTKGNSIPNF
jgi:hypothetical protein